LYQRAFIFFLILTGFSFATPIYADRGKLTKAYAALSEFDYFKARKLFYEINARKTNAAACYGLAWITARIDNPFSQPDTAASYVNRSYHLFLQQPMPQEFGKFRIDSVAIRRLADTIAEKALQRVRKENTVSACDKFLLTNFLCRKKYIYDVIYLRDELEFNAVMSAYRSDSTRHFITTHPQSILLKDALLLLDRQIFDESVKKGTPEELLAFIRRYPKNVLLNSAFEKLFEYYKRTKDQEGLSNFVSEFPKTPQNLEAWKLLFSLTVKAYTYADLKKFIDDYPKFPLKSSILKDLELNKLILVPVQMGDYSGFVNQNGTVVIPAVYEEVSEFSEGLAVVSRNDSTFYINKENENVFSAFFMSAGPFRNGVAAVQQDSKWYFINRLGQSISSAFTEIQEYSGGAYVFRNGNLYGALDQYGQALIEPQFSKLGDFKNGFAYYMEQNRYGFVSREGMAYKAVYDWISDFNEEQIAVIRQNGHYGLILGNAKILLPCEWDLIVRGTGRFFIVVKDNQYGFFSFDGCFIALPQYDYAKEKSPEYYGNERYFRLIRKNETSLADHNGRVLLNAGVYQDFGFPAEGMIRVKQRNKWGFLDKRLAVAIPFRYQLAEDFEGGNALVKLKEKQMMIASDGTEIYSSLHSLKRLNSRYVLEEEEGGRRLIAKNGKVLQEGILEADIRQDGTIILKLINGEIKLIND